MAQADPPAPSLAIVIVNYRTPDLAIGCVEALAAERAQSGPFEVMLADGGSGDGSAEKLSSHFAAPEWQDWVCVLPLAINGGFGWANNQAMLRLLQRPEPPRYIFLLNPDTVIIPGTLAAMIAEMEADPQRGATGGLMYNGDRTLQISAHRFPDWRSELAAGARMPRIARLLGKTNPGLLQGEAPVEVDWVSGSNVMFRADALRQCGLFDHGFFLYSEEIELMARLKHAGWTVWQTPNGGVIHEGGASTNVSRDPAVRRRTPLPAYWYQSERRCMTLIHGRAAARLSFWGWLSARLTVGALRWLLLPSVRAGSVYRDLRNKWAAWREPVACAATPHIAHWDDPPDSPPAWEAWR